MMVTTLVNLMDRPELAHVTGAWRWEAFFRDGKETLADLIARECSCASSRAPIPTVLVMLDGTKPIGMITLCLDDIDGRPELNPWLAGLYVDPAYRGRGHGRRLIGELEALASGRHIKRLSLYTSAAVGLYAKVGWSTVETFERKGKAFSIMQKHID